MNLSQLSTKPVLVKVTLDDEATIEEFKEPLDFYTWDRQPMDVFMKLSQLDHTKASEVIDIVKMLILDDKGGVILSKENMLPTRILMRAIAKVSELLGK